LKKIATLLLLSIFCFNWIGYRLLLSYAENKADRQLEANLDNQDYDKAQLVSIKLPLSHFSAYINAMGFERADGQLECNGICYNYVKIRIYNDSLELLCIPNQKVINLRQAKDNYFKLVSDMQQRSNKNQGNHFIKIISAYFLLTGYQFLGYCLYYQLFIWPEFINELARNFYSPVIENPPE
jgi:hypothetical protein